MSRQARSNRQQFSPEDTNSHSLGAIEWKKAELQGGTLSVYQPQLDSSTWTDGSSPGERGDGGVRANP